jgi:signal transduction histidine kinase/ActR/RegA family two-component response regulator/PAS domain-containing protein
MKRESFNEDQIENSEFSSLLKHAACGICAYQIEIGKTPKMMYMTEGFCDICEASKEEIYSAYERDRMFGVHTKHQEQMEQTIKKAILTGEEQEINYQAVSLKGRKKWCTLRLSPDIRENGIIILFGTFFDITKQMKVQNKISDTVKILEVATKNADVWYWNCHWRENLAYMGERFQNDFNLPAELTDFSAHMFEKNIVDEAYREDFLKMCKKITNGEKEAQVVVKGYFIDGTAHWMRFKLSNIFDENGIAREAVGIMHLVDDVKEMERKYEIEKRHAIEDKNLIAHGCYNISSWEVVDYAGNYMLDAENGEISVEMIGQAIVAEATDVSVKEKIMKMHNRQYLLDAYAEGNTEFSLEYQRTLADGKCIWVCSTYHIITDQYGTDLLLFEYCYNINVKKTMNILMDFAVNDDYDLMGFVNMQDEKAIMMYGKNSYNPRHKEILEDDYDRSLMEFANNAVLEEEREKYLQKAKLKEVAKYLEHHDNLEFYFNIRNKDGEKRAKKVRYLKYKQDDNAVIFIQSDITQLIQEQKKAQKTLEEALERAKEANEAKTNFLSQMSHDIRTPMNGIIGMIQLARENDNPKDTNDCLDKMKVSSNYLLSLINDILDLNKVESGKIILHPEVYSVKDFYQYLNSVIKPMCEQRELNLNINIEGILNGKSPYVDKLRVNQIFFNLVSNAVKFTPEGGTIGIHIWFKFIGENKISLHGSVSDTGIGMSEEFQKHMFETFTQEEQTILPQWRGSGLGLSIVKHMMDLMNGTIQVESTLGKGTTFTIHAEVPVVETPKEEAILQMEAAGGFESLKGKHILLAEDHPLNQEIAMRILEKKGMRVMTADNGERAVELMETSGYGYFDLVLMDIRMPVMDGLTAAGKIRQLKRKDAKIIPIIAMTANAFDQDVQECIDAGMNEHLPKPVDPEKLYQTILKWVK